MLTRTVNTTKQVPVELFKFDWYGPVTNPALAKLKCTACRKSIGKTRWGIGWYNNGKGNVSMRLCEACGEEAQKQVAFGRPEKTA